MTRMFRVIAGGRGTLLAAATILMVASAGDALAQSRSIGLANPASLFCTQQGGKSAIVTDETGGQRGLCQLPDGRTIEEWRLFRCSNPDTRDRQTPPCTDNERSPRT